MSKNKQDLFQFQITNTTPHTKFEVILYQQKFQLFPTHYRSKNMLWKTDKKSDNLDFTRQAGLEPALGSISIPTPNYFRLKWKTGLKIQADKQSEISVEGSEQDELSPKYCFSESSSTLLGKNLRKNRNLPGCSKSTFKMPIIAIFIIILIQ